MAGIEAGLDDSVVAAKEYTSSVSLTIHFAKEGVRLAGIAAAAATAASSQPSRPIRILDVASGPGPVALVAARELMEASAPPGSGVIATDCVSDMVELCRNNVLEAGLESTVQCKCMDGQDMGEIETVSVDFVFCQFGIMFFGDPAGGVAEMRRVLRPGSGVLVITTWERVEAMEVLERALAAVCGRPDLSGDRGDLGSPGDPLAFADDGRLRRLLVGAGLRDVRLRRRRAARNTTPAQLLAMRQSSSVVSALFRRYGAGPDHPLRLAAVLRDLEAHLPASFDAPLSFDAIIAVATV